MNKLVKFLVVAGLVLSVPGCGSSLFNAHIKDQETLRSMAIETGRQLNSGNGQIAGGAQGINPGVRVAASITYEAVAHYVGLAGQFTFAKSGALSGPLSEKDQDFVNSIANDTTLAQQEKRKIIRDFLFALIEKDVEAAVPSTQPSE